MISAKRALKIESKSDNSATVLMDLREKNVIIHAKKARF